MKNAIFILLITNLLVAIATFLAATGLFGGSGSSHSATVYDYKALNAEQMDNVGFRAVAAEEGIEVSESGEINFPQEMVEKIAVNNKINTNVPGK